MPIRVIPLAILSLMLLVQAVGVAQNAPPTEYQLKAAFLWNFAKFIEWPTNAFASDSAPFVIGVLISTSGNPFGNDLENTLKGKLIDAHPIVIKEIRETPEATNCHILFVSPSEKGRWPELFRHLQSNPVLTVSEAPRFTDSGGMINFVIEDNKIHFQINDNAAKAAGLKISSKLLRLATKPP